MNTVRIRPLNRTMAIAGIVAIILGQPDSSLAQWIHEPETTSQSAPEREGIAKDKPPATSSISKDKTPHPPEGDVQIGELQVNFQLARVSEPEEPDINFGRYLELVPGFGVIRPHALQGTTAIPPVQEGVPKPTGFAFPLRLEALNVGGEDQTLTLRLLPGATVLGADLTFRDPHITSSENSLGYAVNLSALSHEASAFDGGSRDVNLANGENPTETRWGGGIQVFRSLSETADLALGLNYQQVSFSDKRFGSQKFRQDEAGNALTASGNNSDDLLTVNVSAIADNRNSAVFPTQGSRLQVGLDQAIPVGAANIGFTRFGLNYTHFWPVDWIRVSKSTGTVLFNIQGGAMPFDEPPGYEAYTLGGTDSVRGYGTGEVGNPQNFLQGSLEYRFPFADLPLNNDFLQSVFGDSIVVAGNIFLDAATGFDSDDNVLGQPGVVRGKPGDGLGYGFGVLATSSIGLIRLEFAISDLGDTSINFSLGDRF